MREKGYQPDTVTFLCTLKACCDKSSTCQGMSVHNHVVQCGFDSQLTIKNAILNMYCKCGRLEEAQKVFDMLDKRTVFSWGSLMAGYVQHGHANYTLQLFERLQAEKIQLNVIIYSSALKACNHSGNLKQGRIVHDSIVQSGLQSDLILDNTLIDMYAKCGSVAEAHNVFYSMPKPDIVSWGALIAGYAAYGPSDIAFELFNGMQHAGLQPCKTTFLSILKACVTGEAVGNGRLIHDQIIKRMYEVDVTIGNTLISMYAKCGCLEEACKVFEKLQDPNTVSWGALIAGYSAQGLGSVAIQLFQEMHLKGMAVVPSILTCVIKVCSDERYFAEGRLLHSLIIEVSIQEESVENMLADMYARFANLEDAQSLFKVSDKGNDFWASFFRCCSEDGSFDIAFEIFDMIQQKMKPSSVVYSSILKVCNVADDLHMGKLIHHAVIIDGLESDVIIGNTLIDMHAKLGGIEDAQKVFLLLINRDNVSWGALITGYVDHGLYVTALKLYVQAQLEKIKLTEATILSILKACGSLGAINQGMMIHDQIIKDAVLQDAAIGSALLCMYAKCGRLQEAQAAFGALRHQDVVAWGALIAGYTWNGQIDCALRAFKDMQTQGFKPDDVLFTNILAACSHKGLVSTGHFYFASLIEEYGMRPGMEQISCMIDLLGRSGKLREAHDMLLAVPDASDSIPQLSLLTNSRTYQNVLEEKQFDSKCP
ncbi:hypothetical protein KP509_1Z062400 [Ceratopteris richardii]|nr:hypothetical protein KP509_1Z062400 [Ceratopteris richardii]